MPDDSSASGDSDRLPVARWLQPVDDAAPSGEDLEYDLQFLEFTQAAAGKAETQFAPAEPPNWPEVENLAAALFERTRDLRVAIPWCRARLNLGGLVELSEGLRLLHGLLDTFWDSLHPGLDPDDGDPFARINAMGTLAELDGLLGDARNVLLVSDRRLGGARARDIEIGLDRLSPRDDETPMSIAHIGGLLGDHPEPAATLRAGVQGAQAHLKALQRLMNDRFGIERSPDVKPLRGLLEAVASVIPAEGAEAGSDDGDDASAASGGDGGFDGAGSGSGDDVAPARSGGGGRSGGARRGGGVLSVDSREDALRAIHLVCQYLERAEPTNPAQLLLRRAERLIDSNFLQLIKQFAPDAMNEVARVMGVDPDSIGD